MTATPPAKPADTRGLAGQSVGDTTICSVNQTQLIYRGYEIADLAAHATFEEVAFLLLVGHKQYRRDTAASGNVKSAARSPDLESIRRPSY